MLKTTRSIFLQNFKTHAHTQQACRVAGIFKTRRRVHLFGNRMVNGWLVGSYSYISTLECLFDWKPHLVWLKDQNKHNLPTRFPQNYINLTNVRTDLQSDRFVWISAESSLCPPRTFGLLFQRGQHGRLATSAAQDLYVGVFEKRMGRRWLLLKVLEVLRGAWSNNPAPSLIVRGCTQYKLHGHSSCSVVDELSS